MHAGPKGFMSPLIGEGFIPWQRLGNQFLWIKSLWGVFGEKPRIHWMSGHSCFPNTCEQFLSHEPTTWINLVLNFEKIQNLRGRKTPTKGRKTTTKGRKLKIDFFQHALIAFQRLIKL